MSLADGTLRGGLASLWMWRAPRGHLFGFITDSVCILFHGPTLGKVNQCPWFFMWENRAQRSRKRWMASGKGSVWCPARSGMSPKHLRCWARRHLRVTPNQPLQPCLNFATIYKNTLGDALLALRTNMPSLCEGGLGPCCPCLRWHAGVGYKTSLSTSLWEIRRVHTLIKNPR